MAVDSEMEAVFKSSRADKDPVSGNDVPTGSLPEEVRDDIPAQLSEGEYVVPADVVRYYGIKFFEELRQEAKAGWQNMEENGRIGGEPTGMEMGNDELPFDISELQMEDTDEQPEMNAGGYIGAYELGGYQPSASYGDTQITVKEYVGPDGQRIYIQFMGNVPLTAIPTGYEPAETAAEKVAQTVEEQTTQASNDDNDPPPVEQPEPIDWKTATADQFDNYIQNKDSTISKVVKTGAAVLGGLPMMGFMKLATKMEDKRVRAGLESQLSNPDLDETTRTRLQGILDGITKGDDNTKLKDGKSGDGPKIFGGDTKLLSDNLEDRDKSGTASFGDTWLGDLLGFDGTFGVQGPDLAASRSGARRDGQPDSDGIGSTPTTTTSSPSIPATSGTQTQSFSEAFKEARAKQGAGGTFEYGGKSYSTNTAEDEAKKNFNPDGST